MKQSLEPSLDFTLHSEGGYQCLRSDPGNWTGGRVGSGQLIGTKYGLSAALVVKSVPGITQKEMKTLTEENFRLVAKTTFWTPLECDALPSGLDLMVFDHGFNAGQSASTRLVQQIAGARTDGIMGPATLKAIANISAVSLISYLTHEMTVLLQQEMMLDETGTISTDMRAKLNCLKWRPSLWCCALAAMQAVDYRKKRNFSIFGKSWLSRVQQRTKAALELCRETRLKETLPAAKMT